MIAVHHIPLRVPYIPYHHSSHETRPKDEFCKDLTGGEFLAVFGFFLAFVCMVVYCLDLIVKHRVK